MVNNKYTYSFDELSNLIAKDKGLPIGPIHFNMTFNGNDPEKILVVEISPPKNEDVKGGLDE